ncbi:unnamed protein product [Closterium sp. Naga37s-1]|nr:unnamed protein product [Closterium sp. Naga37s-1]
MKRRLYRGGFPTHPTPCASARLLHGLYISPPPYNPPPSQLLQNEMIVLGRLSHSHGYCMDRIQPTHLPNSTPPTLLNPSHAERALSTQLSPLSARVRVRDGGLLAPLCSHPPLCVSALSTFPAALPLCLPSTPVSPTSRLPIPQYRLYDPSFPASRPPSTHQVRAESSSSAGTCASLPLSASGELFFSWNMRLKVAVQVAEALAYMHGLNFIHRDLKAANVLLSPDYDAKLTDFGMVRVGPEGQLESIVSTRIMGTEGYIDPTYMETGHLGAKSDVYSFGVLLLELVTGRRVVDEGSKMVTECRTRLSDLSLKAAEYVDPHLGNQYPELGARTLATLARHCVAEARSSRPDIGSVLEKLKLLVEACANAEAKAAAKAAALEAGESGSAERGDTEVNGGEEGSSAAVAPVQVTG